MNWRVILAGILLPVAACHTAKKAATADTRELEPMVISANNNPVDIFRESAPRIWDIQHTRVALQFNYQEKTAEGQAVLDMSAYAAPTDSIVLDAKKMKIHSVSMVAGGSRTNVDYRYENDRLIMKRNTSFPQNVQLYISYTAMPYADSVKGGSKAITDDKGLYFINTDQKIAGKPVQIWTQGETESNSHWMPTNDKPNERFTVELELTVPDSFQTLGSGALISSKKMQNGLRTDLWKMDKPIQAYAVMFAIGKYAIVKDNPWNGKEISYYVEQEYEPYAKLIFRHTPEMMAYFSSVTGVPYPWNKYSQIIARDYVSGAMENTTASLFGEFVNQNDREIDDKNYEDVVSHELFHQWFGDYVTMESWSNLTVSESFANYGEQLWRRYQYGDASADELAYNDLSEYLQSAERNDPQLVRFYYKDKEEMFDRISYNKGGATLRYLHGLIGDPLFCKAMNLYLTRNALQSTEATHWRLAVEEATGRDWNWFFNQWYYKAGHPDLDVSYAYNDSAKKLTVTVKQNNPSDSLMKYQLPLRTGVINGDELTLVDWNLKKRTEVFTYPYVNGKRPVIVPDYYAWLPGNIKDHKRPATWLEQYRHVPDYVNKRKALAGVNKMFNDADSKALFELALKDSLDGIRMRALNLLGNMGQQDRFVQQVIYMAVQDRSNRVRAAAFNCLGQWKVNSLRTEMLEAVDDRSYMVAGAALKSLNTIAHDEAYDKAKKMLAANPRAALEAAIWDVIAEEARPADFKIFSEKADRVYGQRRVNLAGDLAVYTQSVADIFVFNQCLELLDKLYQAENVYQPAIFYTVLSPLSDLKAHWKGKDETRAVRAKAMLQRWVDGMKDKTYAQVALDRSFK